MDIHPLTPRSRLGCALFLALCLVVSGCSNDDQPVTREVANRSVVEEAPPLDRVLIPTRAIENEPPGSPRQAFLEYWSFLQHQAVSDAVDLFDAGLVRHIGADQIAEAFKSQAAYFRSVRPRITGVRSRGDTATVFYDVRDSQGKETPRSVRWRRAGGEWTVIYDPFLDIALKGAVQRATQTALDPLKSEPGPRALQAGDGASRLQSTYLKQQLER